MGPASLARSVVRRLRQLAGPPAPALTTGASHDEVFANRDIIAARYLRGRGIEIGAAHQPLGAPPGVAVTYVDRQSAEDFRQAHPELGDVPLVDVGIIDHGETLATIPDATQDFVVANHFLEHCEDPIGTIKTLLRVTRSGGMVFMAVPDKRFTFDEPRPCTPLEHVKRDFLEGPAWSRRQHFEEWSRLVCKRDSEDHVQAEVAHLMNIGYSIHYHVWGADELLEFLSALRAYVTFEIELFLRNGFENLVVLRKR